jgi:hypothetical protein
LIIYTYTSSLDYYSSNSLSSCGNAEAALLAPWWSCLLMMKKKGVSWSVFREGGFGPRSFHLSFHSVLIKIHLNKPYTVRKISFCSFRVFSSFLLKVLFSRRYFISQKQLISVWRGGKRPVTFLPGRFLLFSPSSFGCHIIANCVLPLFFLPPLCMLDDSR